MKKTIDHLIILFVFLLLALLIGSFPIRGIDITWALESIKGIGDFLYTVNGKFLSSILFYLFTKSNYLRVILSSIITITLFISMGKTVDKNNRSLIPISGFLFFTMDKVYLSRSFTTIYGFTNHIIGSLFTILMVYLISKDKFYKIKPIYLGLIGLCFTMLNPIYTFLIFLLVGYDTYKKSKTSIAKYQYYAFFGTLLGFVITVLNTRLHYVGFSYNLIHTFIDSIRGTNFLIIIILSGLILVSSIKLFLRNFKIESILSIIGMSGFMFLSLLSKNNNLVYIFYLIYLLSSFYVLTNMSTSKIYQTRISLYYLVKVMFIIIISLMGNITIESTILLYLIDIILILELYNVLLPKNFLNIVWTIMLVIILSANIYVFKNIEKKYDEVSIYIKNKLECTSEDIIIPNRYNNEYIVEYLPKNNKELKEYIKYYDIEPYGEVDFELKYKE